MQPSVEEVELLHLKGKLVNVMNWIGLGPEEQSSLAVQKCFILRSLHLSYHPVGEIVFIVVLVCSCVSQLMRFLFLGEAYVCYSTIDLESNRVRSQSWSELLELGDQSKMEALFLPREANMASTLRNPEAIITHSTEKRF